MAKLIFNSMDLNPDSFFEKPNPQRLIETTGYEKIGKTVDRLMVAGMNLYMANRNGDYQGDDPDLIDEQPPAQSKYFDEKDVKMKMREIQTRLKRKVNAQVIVPDENITLPVVEPDAKPEV